LDLRQAPIHEVQGLDEWWSELALLKYLDSCLGVKFGVASCLAKGILCFVLYMHICDVSAHGFKALKS
jgi:hypothetical protein